MATEEPRHPTYGSLDEFLAALAEEIRQGWEPRIGQLGALAWFAAAYSAAGPESFSVGDQSAGPGSTEEDS